MTEFSSNLSDSEAAILLGITKELLYAYVRNAPKKHLGHKRKLQTVVSGGQNYFEKDELLAFDEYLKESWSDPNDKRPVIPTYIQDYLKSEIGGTGGACPISGKGYPLDNAHIEDYSIVRNHHHHNLIRISKEEHTKVDNGVIPKAILKATKQRLIENIRKALEGKKDSKTQFMPPIANSFFIGREKDLLETIQAIEYTRFVVIQGIGGIGKTQLLLQTLDNVKYEHPVIWLDIEMMRSVTTLKVSLANAINNYFGIQTNDEIILSLKELHITLILDSLEKLLISDPDGTEDFINDIIEKTDNIQLITTSQIDLAKISHPKKTIKIDGLSEASSRILIEDLMEENIPSSETNIQWAINFCNGHPLALKLTSSIVKFYRSWERAIKTLNTGKNLQTPMRLVHGKSNSLDICLSTIYECINDQQRQILNRLKFYPGGIKYQWAENKMGEDFHENIGALSLFFFIDLRFDSLGFERIIVPNPIIPFLAGKILDLEVDELNRRSAFEDIMIEALFVDAQYIESKDPKAFPYGLMRIENELSNILNAFNESRKNAEDPNISTEARDFYLNILSSIASALGRFCFTRGYFNYGKLFSSEGTNASLKLNDIPSAVTNYMYLKQIQLREFDLFGAEGTIRELEKLASETGNEEAILHSSWAKGSLEFAKKNFTVARVNYNRALNLLIIKDEKKNDLSLDFEDTINSVKGNIAILMFEIAKTYEFTGEYEKAINLHRIALQKHEDLGGPDPGSNYNHLAFCLLKIQNFEEGLYYSEKALVTFIRYGEDEYIGNTISDLGRFIELKPSIAKMDFVNAESIGRAIDNMAFQIKHFVNRYSTEFGKAKALAMIPREIIGKLILISHVAALTSHSLIICDTVDKIIEDLQLEMQFDKSLLTPTLNYIHNICGLTEWRDDQELFDRVLRSILQSGLILNGGPDVHSAMRIFFWLALWMRESSLNAHVTAEQIFKQAMDSFES